MTDRNDLVLITGGTGKTGRRVAAQLGRRGVPVRPVSRSTTPPFDWQDRSTWSPALEGVRAVYLAATEVDDGPSAFVRTAVDAGVEQIVLLSARGITTPGYFDRQDVLTAPFLEREKAVTASGARWTILRPGWFMQNFSEGDFTAGIRAGALELPLGESAASWIDAVDIAEVAATVLIDGHHDGEVIELSGPRAVTLGDAVGIIAEVTGRSVAYEPIEPAAYRARLEADGLDENEIVIAEGGLSAIRRGGEAVVLDGVQRVLDREPSTFEQFARREVDAWR